MLGVWFSGRLAWDTNPRTTYFKVNGIISCRMNGHGITVSRLNIFVRVVCSVAYYIIDVGPSVTAAPDQ